MTEENFSQDEELPLPLGDRRKGERRQNHDRRAGMRGLWEERRLFDRRKREYSIFGKRFDGNDKEADASTIPDVPLEELISPAEIEIFREQDEQQNQDQNSLPEKLKRPRKL